MAASGPQSPGLSTSGTGKDSAPGHGASGRPNGAGSWARGRHWLVGGGAARARVYSSPGDEGSLVAGPGDSSGGSGLSLLSQAQGGGYEKCWLRSKCSPICLKE